MTIEDEAHATAEPNVPNKQVFQNAKKILLATAGPFSDNPLPPKLPSLVRNYDRGLLAQKTEASDDLNIKPRDVIISKDAIDLVWCKDDMNSKVSFNPIPVIEKAHCK